MSDLKLDIDIDAISEQFGNLQRQVEKDLKQAVGSLASMTHAKTQELARDALGSLTKKYTDNLSFQQLDENLWVVSLDEKALWIEEGRKCVVYGKNKDHIPKVLTPDGEKPISEIKVGMLVLNQFGKWTKVVEVYDEHLVEKSKLLFHEIKFCNFTPKNKKKNKRVVSLGFVSKCPVCKDIKYHTKVNKKRQKESYCTECLSKQEVYKVEISGSLNANDSKNGTTMYLTGDHKVMTPIGWKEIRDFTKDDSVKVPSWSNCRQCNKKTLYGKDFCYDKKGGICSSKYYIKKTLQNGKHVCQKPEHRSKYMKLLKKIGKSNKTEDLVQKLIEKTYSCSFWDKDIKKTDFYREYPVKVESNGKYRFKYYYLDFYCPKLNLALEIDGKAFHCKKRDSKRDREIEASLGCEIIRIPAKNVWKKNFYNNTLLPIVRNHSNEIQMMDFKGFKVTKVKMKKFSPINRRWDITVEKGESFICNKILIHNSGFMDELLRGKSAKVNKTTGKRYAVIPFEHSKNPSEQSAKAQQLTDMIKSELKERGLSYRKPEYNSDGSPKLGLIKRFNIESAKLKETHKDSPLKGVAIYQRINDSGKVQRDIMTFRVITEDHESKGKWVHPGRAGDFLMDKAFAWAENEWSTKILPEIINSYK